MTLNRRGFTAAALGALAAPAWAAFPDKPVRILVGFAAGGPADTCARLVARLLGDSLGQQVVVENRPGAGGALATTAVQRAPADGHTLLLCAFADVLNPLINAGEARYNIADDFAPITRITGVGNVLVVHPALPVRSVQELIAYARANPGRLNYGSAGIGSASHLAGELLGGLAKVRLTHVPYKGTAQAQVDLQSGVLPFMFDSLISALPNVQAGKVRALAVTTATRSPGAPTVPTMVEAGVPDYDLTSWFGLAAPKGTPAPVVQQIAVAVRQVLKRKEAQDALMLLGGLPDDMAPQEFERYLRAESARWKRLFDDGTVRIDK
jgi:tripartite-type tricarboxylate transporter receptor subunit TctC